MIAQPDHWIAQRPSVGFCFGPISRRIVGRGMSANPIRDVLNERGPQVTPCTLRRPASHGIDGEVVVAIYTERRDAKAQAACSECAGTATRNALEGRDCPLV